MTFVDSIREAETNLRDKFQGHLSRYYEREADLRETFSSRFSCTRDEDEDEEDPEN